uniref:Phosphatidylinositol 3-kinase catalytic subunit type 3 n=1 Tax=Globodera pallida TaxID=36090 RepID=A0A183BU91_GLOPA
MTRNARAMDIDRRLQPNPTVRDALESIIKSSSCQSLLMEERDLIWKFRFWLKSNPKALTKFVRSVNWQAKLEVRQAIQVILEWAPIDACDALELLSPHFTHPFVRRYAVSRLQCTSYANILLFLPQLVQALRYEPQPPPAKVDQQQQKLPTELLGTKSAMEDDLMIVEGGGGSSGGNNASLDNVLPNQQRQQQTPGTANSVSSPTASMMFGPMETMAMFGAQESMDLATFLIRAACENGLIANFLFWYLKVEVEANAADSDDTASSSSVSSMYCLVMGRLKHELSKGNGTARHTLSNIATQKKFVDTLVDIAKAISDLSANRTKKQEVLRKKLSENADLTELKGLSLPLDPSIHVRAVQPESAVLFSSNLMPMRLTFSTVRDGLTPYECAEAYTTFFKRGDDLRQDQLVLQMIRLMDELLKEDKLDLCLTPYAVLAASCSEGFVQFIRGATPLADIKSIQRRSTVALLNMNKTLEHDGVEAFAGVHALGQKAVQFDQHSQVYCNGRAVGRSVQTSFRQQTNASAATPTRDIQKWDEWLTLPVCYSELSRDAILHFTIWEVGNSIEPVLVAQCAKQLFSKHAIFRSGLIDLTLDVVAPQPNSADKQKATQQVQSVHPPVPMMMMATNNARSAEQSEEADDSTPLLQQNKQRTNDMPGSNKRNFQFGELLKKEKLYKQKFIDRVDWLDGITFARLEEIKQEAKIEDRSLFLTVEFPAVEHADDPAPYSIIFFAEDAPREQENVNGDQSDGGDLDSDPLIPSLRSGGVSTVRRGGGAGRNGRVVDPELDMDNLCEIKHNMMTRNARAMDIDRRLQPNPTSSSCQSLLMEERDLIWKFRFWLKSNPKALTKFVRSVNWQAKLEVRQAIQVILEWAPIDACDALELLSPHFTHPFVRRYAVSRLQCTSYANILLFLPQLVQALRYEPQPPPAKVDQQQQKLPTELLGTKSAMEDDLMIVEGSQFGLITTASMMFGPMETMAMFGAQESMDLATFLIRAACENGLIANFLFWYLKVEVEANAAESDDTTSSSSVSSMYCLVMGRLKHELSKGNGTARHTLSNIATQKKFVDTLVDIAKAISDLSANRTKKQEVLRKKLSENADMTELKGLSLPLDPSIHVRAVQPESAVLFSSNLMPMRLTFSTVRDGLTPYECAEAYTTIFKRGDDLRQDQLVLQMIRLMDELLKEDKLDLCLTPYAVLATSCSEGFVQFIRGATPLADIKSIQDTLRTFRPSSSAPYGIEADVLNNYVKSCAGYSVICYILGIGDRHLHNLLLCENGKMFHVDFGFILGRDPKPMPPAMKLTSEMVNAMGGQNSEHFRAFVNYCTTAFCILRRHANLITNLFSLMLDAGIPDIAVERDKAVMKVLERFHLQLSDEEACHLIVRLIESSLSAKIPIVMDFVHNVKQFISN